MPVESAEPELVVKLPARPLTLDDVTELARRDEFHRYELADGVLIVVPPPDMEHNSLISQLIAWFVASEYAPTRLMPNSGVRIAGRTSGRIPDLLVLRRPARRGDVWADPAEVLLVVEVVSPGSEFIDRAIKPTEYARAGLGHYWRVERDGAKTTIHQYTLDSAGQTYLGAAVTSLDELLAGEPPQLEG